MYNHGITVASLVHGVTEMITAVMMHDVTVMHDVTQCKVLKWCMVFQWGVVLQLCI